MNGSAVHRIFLAAITFAMAGESYAAEKTPPVVIASGSLSRVGGQEIVPTFPVEQILESLRESQGFAFIFDSRLIEGKSIRNIDSKRRPERALEEELNAVQLQLNKVSAKTYAITRATQANDTALASFPIDGDGARRPIDTILVMGASPKFDNAAGSKRLFSIDADDLAYFSATNPAEAIYSLPQSLASFTPSNTALLASAAGISLADLRGLNPKRTMVLFNGRRRTLTTGGNGEIGGVDLGSIAEPLLERIEVQSLPGGARFGAGAVAGTINFVTKSNLDGLEAGARLGISERGDSEEISLHAIGGRSIENFGNITAGFSVSRNEGLIGADREFSAEPYGFALNGVRSNSPDAEFLPGFGGSSITDRGMIGGVILSDGSFSAFPGNTTYVPEAGSGLSPYVGAVDQLYNWEAWQNVILPNDRIIGQFAFNTDLTRNLKYFLEVQGGVVATDNMLAPLPASQFRGADPVSGDAAVIPLDNPFLPQSVKDLVLADFGASAAAVVFEHRYAELGPRRQQVDRRHLDIATGLRFGEDDARNFSLTYRFGRNRTTSREKDRVDLNKLKIALDPTQCAVTPSCSLVDFFTAPEISSAALDFISLKEIRRELTIEEHEIAAAASTPLSFGDNFDGRATAGFEFRRAAFKDQDLTPGDAAPVGYLGGADTKEVVSTVDAYAEVETPLLRSDGFPGAVDGSLAVRITQSPNFDVATNFEAGVDWRPVEGVTLFTRQHVGERTPDIMEMFSTGPTLESFFTDPCGFDPSDQSPAVKTNCASAGPLGVGAGFVQTAPLASSTFYGNPDLKPERVRSGAYGITLSPTDIFASLSGRMQLTATWLDFDIRDAITNPINTLDDCFSSDSFSSPACGLNPRTGAPSILRDPVTRQIVSYDSVLFNGGEFEWSGLDLEFRYVFQPEILSFADSVWVSVLHTYTDHVASTQYGSETRLDGLINFPHHRTLASAGVEAGRWSFVAYANRRGKTLTARSSRPEARVPAALYLDLTGRFDVTDSAYIQASVKNLTDKKPAITAFNSVGNFAPEFYDPVGRRFFLSVKLSF
jgi:outer membrane receptor protein involved in Fe transport